MGFRLVRGRGELTGKYTGKYRNAYSKIPRFDLFHHIKINYKKGFKRFGEIKDVVKVKVKSMHV